MARSRDTLFELIIYSGAAYLAYNMTLNGAFGTKAQNWVKTNLNYKKLSPPSPGSSPTGGGNGHPGMDANNYVAPFGNGWVVVVNGQRVSGAWTTGVVDGVFPTQESAERAYNIARGWG